MRGYGPATAAKAAAKGAKLLDVVRPGWEKEIDLTHLDLASGSYCVLGNLYGSYAPATFADDVREALQGKTEEFTKTIRIPGLRDIEITVTADVDFLFIDQDQQDYGFVILMEMGTAHRYSMLTEAWIAEIRKRLGRR